MNIFFGAVKYLLRPDDALAAWYPHLATSPREPGPDAVDALRDFVSAHHEEIVALGATHRTQTNEVGRAALIMPWLAQASAHWGEPVHAVDIGASAGLNLCLDQFAYRYGDHHLGESAVTLTCENRGGFPLPDAVPTFAWRTGIDIHPMDATDPDQARWLEALVWPEHTDRLARLSAAIELRARTPVTMIEGDAAHALLDLEATLPAGPMLVWHTVARYQFSPRQSADLDAALVEISGRREIARVGLEPTLGGLHPEVRVGLNFEEAPPVAIAHSHGYWMDVPG